MSRHEDNGPESLEDTNASSSSQASPPVDALFILKKLEEDRKAYQVSLDRTHELLTQVLTGTPANLESNLPPHSKPFLVPQHVNTSPAARLTRDVIEDRGTVLNSVGSSGHPRNQNASSVYVEIESFSESEQEDVWYAQDPLPAKSHDMERLKIHIVGYDWTEAGQKLLGPLPHNMLGRTLPENLKEVGDQSEWCHCSIFDVLSDGIPLPYETSLKSHESRARNIWNRISHVNTDQSCSAIAVGRVTIVREPSPLLFAALHLTFEEYFDMDEIFKLLTANEIKVFPHRAWSEDLRHRRTFVFAFNYLTIIGEARRPLTWQHTEEELDDSETYMPIARCGSVVALSLLGEPICQPVNRERLSEGFREHGAIFHSSAPWHVLSITAYPDWKSTIDLDGQSSKRHSESKRYMNGPEAFLDTLRIEFKDAQTRFMEIQRRISDLVSTPSDFMFRRSVRDRLFFDDANFSYLRKFFWAFQALSTMNDIIYEMRTSYQQAFDDDIWEGNNHIIWSVGFSPRHPDWLKRMKDCRLGIEKEIRGLEDIIRVNDEKLKEISALRQNLFSGTSVMEGRKAVKQGQNIKTLTLVTIFFLPLMFVTSVFGMTNMNPSDNFVRFGIVLVVICLPTYMIIGFLDSERGFNVSERMVKYLPGWPFQRPERKGNSEIPLEPLGKSPKSRFWSKSRSTTANKTAHSQPPDSGSHSVGV